MPNEQQFRVTRGGQQAVRLFSESEVRDFLDACGLPEDSPGHEFVLAGGVLHIDGADMEFQPVESKTPSPSPWKRFTAFLKQHLSVG